MTGHSFPICSFLVTFIFGLTIKVGNGAVGCVGKDPNLNIPLFIQLDIPKNKSLICDSSDFVIDSGSILRASKETINPDCNFVNLSHSGLKGIDPKAFSGLSYIETLYLAHNELKTLEKGLFDYLWRKDDLNFIASYNKIENIEPGVFDNMYWKDIALDSNEITRLKTNTFGSIFSVKEFCMTNTKLTAIEYDAFQGSFEYRMVIAGASLNKIEPLTFHKLSGLQFLNLHELELTELPNGAFDGLRSLTHLDLRLNYLSELPERIFDDVFLSAGLMDGSSKPLKIHLNAQYPDPAKDFVPLPTCGIYNFLITEENNLIPNTRPLQNYIDTKNVNTVGNKLIAEGLIPSLPNGHPGYGTLLEQIIASGTPVPGHFCGALNLTSYPDVNGFNVGATQKMIEDKQIFFMELHFTGTNISCCEFYDQIELITKSPNMTIHGQFTFQFPYYGNCMLNGKDVLINRTSEAEIRTQIADECGHSICNDDQMLSGGRCTRCRRDRRCLENFKKEKDKLCYRNGDVASCEVCNREASAPHLRCAVCEKGFGTDQSGSCVPCKSQVGCISDNTIDSCLESSEGPVYQCLSHQKDLFYMSTTSPGKVFSCRTDQASEAGYCLNNQTVQSCKEREGQAVEIKCSECTEGYYITGQVQGIGQCSTCKNQYTLEAGNCLDLDSVKDCQTLFENITCVECKAGFRKDESGFCVEFVALNSEGSEESKIGIIAGAVVGSLVLIALIIGVVAVVYIKKKKEKDRLFGLSAQEFVMDTVNPITLQSDIEYDAVNCKNESALSLTGDPLEVSSNKLLAPYIASSTDEYTEENEETKSEPKMDDNAATYTGLDEPYQDSTDGNQLNEYAQPTNEQAYQERINSLAMGMRSNFTKTSNFQMGEYSRLDAEYELPDCSYATPDNNYTNENMSFLSNQEYDTSISSRFEVYEEITVSAARELATVIRVLRDDAPPQNISKFVKAAALEIRKLLNTLKSEDREFKDKDLVDKMKVELIITTKKLVQLGTLIKTDPSVSNQQSLKATALQIISDIKALIVVIKENMY